MFASRCPGEVSVSERRVASAASGWAAAAAQASMAVPDLECESLVCGKADGTGRVPFCVLCLPCSP